MYTLYTYLLITEKSIKSMISNDAPYIHHIWIDDARLFNISYYNAKFIFNIMYILLYEHFF